MSEIVSIENEIKLRIDDLAAVRSALSRMGAHSVNARAFEDNLILDDASSALRAAGCLLRLRRAGTRCVITYKGPRQAVEGIKSRQEIEMEASGFEAAQAIFTRLGYRTIFRYQKYREVFAYKNARIMVDETPIGSFLEIEGLPAMIHETAAKLGFETGDYMAESYADLFFAAGGSGDMVFR